MSDSIFLGSRAGSLDIGDIPSNISRVNLSVGSETYYTAGNDTGRTLEVTCAWASQAMASSILAAVQNVEYQPYTAGEALIDPAAEIGDGVVVGGIYSVIANDNMSFSRLYNSEISAPDLDEVDDEYPYESLERRQYDRELARTRSMISKSASEILLQVEGIAEDLEGQISSISVKVDSITLDVSNGSTSSTISLKAGDVTISSETIQMDGLVTFTGLSSGTTTVNGACIKTGQIEADRLNLTGSITFSDLSSSVQGDINQAQSTANSAQQDANQAWNLASSANSTANSVNNKVSGWTFPGTTEINGQKIMTGTVEASILRGGTVELLASGGSTVGSIEITSTATGVGLEFVTNRGGMRMTSAGNWWVDASPGSFGMVTGAAGPHLTMEGNVTPNSDDRYSCGESQFRWTDVWATNDQIRTSDRNIKTDISYDISRYDHLFDLLRPVSYKLINGSSGRTHMGLIAQDVEAALYDSGISTQDCAAFIKNPGTDEKTGEPVYRYAIRYGEFIPLLIYQVQKIKEALKDKGVIS